MFKITFSTIYRHDFHKNCRSFKQFTKNNHFFKKEIPKAPTGYLTQPAQPRRRRKPGGPPFSLLLVFCRSFSALRGKCAAFDANKTTGSTVVYRYPVWENCRPSRQQVSHISWSLIILLSCKTASSYPFADLSSMISFCISLFPGKANAP